MRYLYVQIFREISSKINTNHHREQTFFFDPTLTTIANGYIEGFFQTEKYFKAYEEKIRQDFTFFSCPTGKNKELIEQIENANTVSVHIRRGDYLQRNIQRYQGMCSLQYYHTAIAYFTSKIKNSLFLFFSDDIDRVKKHFAKEGYIYADFNTGNSSREDMRLMSLCRHNIIANSSFSWWGAWLNTNPKKIVIAPKKRAKSKYLDYSDIIPNTWMKI